MPEIYTMCVPHDEDMHEPESSCIPLKDLQHIRQQVLDIALNAPASRMDNMISRLSDSAQTLLLHARVINALKFNTSRLNRSKWISSVSLTLMGGLITAGLWYA